MRKDSEVGGEIVPWRVRRADGRSNAQVLADLIRDASPGDIFTYESLAQELGKGTETVYDRAKVQSTVLNAVPHLERVHRRTLTNVPRRGYRVAPASEHMAVSARRQTKANRQLRKGLHTLQHVRWSEMSENERRAHEGHLLIASAVYEQTRSLDHRLSRVEAAIRGLSQQGPPA